MSESQRSFGGGWTHQKLAILRSYMDAYTTALKQTPFQLIYVDAFAGSGRYLASDAGDQQPNLQISLFLEEYVEMRDLHKGSASLALEVTNKPFDRLVFVDNDQDCVQALRGLRTRHPNRNIAIHKADANDFVPELCNSMGAKDRALVFLDPFATEVSWNTVKIIAATEKIDCWILFPLMAVTRMMPVNSEPDPRLVDHLDRIFGGREDWNKEYYDQPTVFDNETIRTRLRGSKRIADLYKKRLRSVFYRVAKTQCTLKNSRNGPMFELFFAASNPRGRAAEIAIGIADHILKKW